MEGKKTNIQPTRLPDDGQQAFEQRLEKAEKRIDKLQKSLQGIQEAIWRIYEDQRRRDRFL